MRRLVTLLVSVTAIALIGCPGDSLFPWCDDPKNPCPPVDPNYPESDADGLGSQGGRACRSLRASGCSEGYRDPRTGRTCFQRLESAAQIAKVPYQCLIDARTPDQVRSCGTKDTLRYRCRQPALTNEPTADGGVGAVDAGKE